MYLYVHVMRPTAVDRTGQLCAPDALEQVQHVQSQVQVPKGVCCVNRRPSNRL